MLGRHSQTQVRRRSPVTRALLVAAGVLAIAAPAAGAVPRAAHHWGPVLRRGTGSEAQLIHPSGQSRSATDGTLTYGGGGGVTGVVTGAPKVYLVVWGPSWGSPTPAENGFSGDPKGEVAMLAQYFSGLGTNGDQWSRVLTQYCESGPSVREPTGTATCREGTTPVSYPGSGALAGIWQDASALPSQSPTATDLAKEAQAAAAHFDDRSADAVYVILSASGTHPDGFNSGSASDNFCGWHDFTADTALGIQAPGDNVAFINMPYVTDARFACGANAVNPGTRGLADGISIVAGHEYAEWMTDPFPGGGWSNATSGDEIGDECMWIPPGRQGAMTDLTLATGTFAIQSTWSNRGNACVTEAATAVRVAPARVISSRQSVPVTFGFRASGPAGRPLVFTASGLPRGMRFDARTGRVSGRPTGRAGTYTVRVTATDTFGPPATRLLTWHIAEAILVSRPRTLSSMRFTTVSVRIRARDLVAHRHLRFRAAGLPAGLRLDAATGRIAGTVVGRRGAYLVRLTASDSGGAWTTTRFTWRVR
jgi:hypothetical protein